jgi:serine/arginine repetitive matrix protein 2
MTEEDGDFLSAVIEFGDGKQYNVAPASESELVTDENPPEDRLGNDFDRSWPASRENGMQPSQSLSSPSASPLTATNPHGERVLFNDRHNRMEPMLPPRQAPTTPTLLHAHPSPQTLRPGTVRRESDGRGFREPAAWNGSSQRSTYANSESSERQGENRLRRPSASERDKSAAYTSGGLGPHLRDRSPDGSGRFPGRNIQRMTRRDSQASSGIVPARSTRALSRESSDRGSAVRQLPPHLGGSIAQAPIAHAPPPLVTSPSSIPSRASWRESPVDTRSPTQVPQTPSVTHSEKMQPGPSSEGAVPLASPDVSQQEVAAALIGDEAALKLAMAVAAERARKRRLEEEEKRKTESEQAKKKKLADLEAKMQAEKEAKEKALKEAEDQARREKEEAERLSRLEADNRAKERERAVQSARMPPPPSRPPMPSDTADSWRGSAPVRPSIATQVQPSGRRLTNGSSDSRRSPTATLKQKHWDHPQSSSTPKVGPVDLSGKPANSAIIAEVAALQSKTADDSVQVLHFSDLRQLAEGYGQILSVNTVAINGSDPSASTEPVVNLKSSADTRPARSHESGSTLAVPHSPVGGGFDDSRGPKPPRPTKSQPPAALNFAPRGSQDHNAPVSAGLSPSWSPRVQDPSQPGYRQAPISVLDDTLSRFKMAIMHSNPVHAGMSSDDIMQGLGRGGTETEKRTQNSTGSMMTGKLTFLYALPLIPFEGTTHSLPHGLGKLTGEPTWTQTRSMEPVEVDDFPSVLIPTLSLKREPVHPKKIQAMKSPQSWRWDHLTFDPPVPTMNRRTLSVMDTLVQGPTGGTVYLRIKVPGAPVRSVRYSESFTQSPNAPSRPRREDLRVNLSSYPSPLSGGLASAPKTAPSGSQWPNKTKGSEEAVWRRAVPVTASLDQPAAPVIPEGSPAIKSAAGTKHSRTFVSAPHAKSCHVLNLLIVQFHFPHRNTAADSEYMGKITSESDCH